MCLTHFATRLKDLMELEGVSQRSLSMHLHVDRKCIRCWLSALYFPKYNVLIKLAAYFKVRIDYLVGLEDSIGDGREYAYPVDVGEKSLDRLHSMLKEYMDTKKLTERKRGARHNTQTIHTRTILEESEQHHQQHKEPTILNHGQWLLRKTRVHFTPEHVSYANQTK
jgi:transcriptional regulator with XRE-family HTH domain